MKTQSLTIIATENDDADSTISIPLAFSITQLLSNSPEGNMNPLCYVPVVLVEESTASSGNHNNNNSNRKINNFKDKK